MAAVRIPVVIVGGFLGSGKTSLLRRALTGAAGTAVIVNEFGAVGLDHHLLRACEERVELVGAGCACCVRRKDLVCTLRKLLDDHDRGRVELSRVVIETSGLADPAPIVFTITNDLMLRHHFSVESLIVTVDACHASSQLAGHAEVAKQIILADELVITKVDLVEPDARNELARQLAALNPSATIHAAVHGVVEEEPVTVATTRSRGARRAGGRVSVVASQMQDARHTDDVRQLSVTVDRPLDWVGFAVWLSMLLHARGEEVLRVKGLLELDDGSFVSVNAVQHVVHMPEHVPPGAITGVSPSIVFITRGLEVDRLRQSLDAFQHLSRGSAGAHVG